MAAAVAAAKGQTLIYAVASVTSSAAAAAGLDQG